MTITEKVNNAKGGIDNGTRRYKNQSVTFR